MQALSEAPSLESTQEVVLERSAELLGASAGLLLSCAQEGAAPRLACQRGPVPEALARWSQQGPQPDTLLGEALRRRQPLRWDSPGGGFALVCLPLVYGGRAVAVLGLAFPERHLPAHVPALLGLLSSHCALALEHARLRESERQCREQAREVATRGHVLAECSHVLSTAELDPNEQLQGLARLVCAHLAEACGVSLVSEDGQHLDSAALHHNDPCFQPLMAFASQQRFRVGEGLTGQVALHGRPLLLAHLGREELLARAAPKMRELVERFPATSVLVVPLRARGQTLGTLQAVRSERPFTPADQEFFEQLAERTAQGLLVARRFLRTERGHQQALLMARLSQALSEPVGYEETLQRLVELCVPELADWCTLNLVEADQRLRRVAVRHRVPALQPLAEALERRFPPERHRVRALLDALESGQPVLTAQVTDAHLVAAAQDEEHLRLMRELGVGSCILVPLAARGRVLGVLSLMRCVGSPDYGPDDLGLARELAARAALAVDNARLHRELREAVRLRENFLSIASHELRTPLTPLYLKLQLLKREVQRSGADAARLKERVLAALTVAEEQVRRLVLLLEELLDVSRLRQGQLALAREPVDLALVVREVALRFEPMASKAGCALRVEASEPAVGPWDALRLEQVTSNLLSNALKYGAGRPVGLEVRTESPWAVLRVSDEGIGIAREDHTRIFERFERAVSEQHYSGLGLGLYISREILRALGGDITVHSTPGQGSCFEARLPLQRP